MSLVEITDELLINTSHITRVTRNGRYTDIEYRVVDSDTYFKESIWDEDKILFFKIANACGEP